MDLVVVGVASVDVGFDGRGLCGRGFSPGDDQEVSRIVGLERWRNLGGR